MKKKHQQSTKPKNTQAPQSQYRSRRGILSAIISGHALVAYGVLRYNRNDLDLGSTPAVPISDDQAKGAWNTEAAKQKELREKLEAEFKGASRSAKSRTNLALSKFNRESRSALTSDLAVANRRAEEVANEITEYRNTLYLAGLLAIDKVRGTSKSEEYLAEKLEPVSKSLFQAHLQCKTSRSRFLSEIENSQNQFQASLGEIVDQDSIGEIPTRWISHYRNVIGKGIGVGKSRAASVGISAALGSVAGLEIILQRKALALLIRKAYNAAKKILTKIVARLAGSSAISGVAVAVDGPLPIGDIVALVVAVIGGIWSAIDVHRDRKKLRVELTSTLKSSLNDSFKDMTQSSEGWAAEITRKCNEINKKAVESTLKGFSVTSTR